jgi:uncharacterized repeat protein (TIGR01451 family)
MSPSNSRRSSVWNWLGGFVGRRRPSSYEPTKPRQSTRRRLRLESLENRALLASDLASITGIVFKDQTGNNVVDAGEQVAGATVNLFVDDGDGVFEPGTQDLAPALPILSSTTTNAQGRYTFSNLTVANYWVQQPAQTVGARTLAESHSLVNVTAADADGALGRVIDNFLSPGPSVTATQGTPDLAVQSTLPTTETIGGERDLRAEMTSGGATDNVKFNAAGSLLNLDPTVNALGNYVATWDGPDGTAASLNATGLGGVDLTEAGINTGILLRGQVDKVNSEITVRVFTNAGNASSMTITNIVPDVLTDLYFPFTGFTTIAGTGAQFTNVGAVQLEIESNVIAMDGLISLVGMVGPTLLPLNFSNYTPADLGITKTVDDSTPNVGQQVQYTITLTNNGPSQATNVIVTDNLPAGVTFVSATPSQGTYNQNTGLWTIGTVNAQANATLTLRGNVTQAGTRTNTATITSVDQNDENPNNNTASAQTVTPQVDLAVLKTVDDNTPNRNQNVTFTITVQNNGPDTATGVTIEDVLPAGLTFVSSTPSVGTFNSATGIWTLGTLGTTAGSNSATLAIVATVATVGANTTITNTASLETVDQTDSNPNNNQDSEVLTPNQLDLALVKTVDDNTPNPNQNVTFTVTVTNNGPVAASGVQVTDVLPAGLTFVSATPSVGTFNNGTGLWTLGALSNTAGQNTATLQIVATVTGTTSITNTATITTVDQFETNTNNNTDTETVVPQVLDLAVAKTVDDNTPDRNQNVTFTVTVTNNGPVAASGVRITDQLPTGLTFVSATPSVGTYSSATGIWTLGALSNTAGQNTATMTIVATVAQGLTTITNTASLTGVDQTDTNAANNQASAALTPNQADLQVTKSVSPTVAALNQETVFTILLQNNGPANATNVQVTDILPTGLTFVAVESVTTGTYDNATGIWNVGSLPATAGQNSATLRIRVRVTGTQTSVTNTANVTQSSQFDPVPNNNTSSSTVTTRVLSKRLFLADTATV